MGDSLRFFGSKQVRVAGEEPTSIWLLAEQAQRVASGSRDVAISHGDGHRKPRAGAGHLATDKALFQFGLRFDARTLHGPFPRSLKFFLAEWRCSGNEEDHVIGQ